ncbi:MAG: hypothetical protein JSS56_05950 [Proteobacteria bacterium]|nr:hypothetical protein [Pseudomonadota bacterium]
MKRDSQCSAGGERISPGLKSKGGGPARKRVRSAQDQPIEASIKKTVADVLATGAEFPIAVPPCEEVAMPYDRDLLLFGAKRHAVLSLEEVQQYGIDNYQDPDYVSIYGLRPSQAHAMGVRLLGRTAVECTRDDLAEAIASDVAALARRSPSTFQLVIDPFAGSGNTIFWLLRKLADARAIAFENDPLVHDISSRNLALLNLPLRLERIEFSVGLEHAYAAPGELVVAFIAPPWGRALDARLGLDLRRTEPPIAGIVQTIVRHFEPNPMLFAIQVHERVEPESLADVVSHFDAFEHKVYPMHLEGQNHGVLIGCVGWSLRPARGKRRRTVGSQQPERLG